MLDKEAFTQKLKSTAFRIGLQGVLEGMRDAFYDVLKNETEKSVDYALNALARNGDKLTEVNIYKYLGEYKSKEAERLHEENKRKTTEAMESLRGQEIPEEARETLDKLFGKNWRG